MAHKRLLGSSPVGLAALDTRVYSGCDLAAAGRPDVFVPCGSRHEGLSSFLYPAGEAAGGVWRDSPRLSSDPSSFAAGALRHTAGRRGCSHPRRLAACRRPPQAACTLQAASAGGLLANSSFRRGCSHPTRLAAAGAFVEPAQPAAAWRVGRLNSLSWIAEFAFVEPAQPYGASVKLTETLVLEFEFKLSGLPKLITDSLILESLQPL